MSRWTWILVAVSSLAIAGCGQATASNDSTSLDNVPHVTGQCAIAKTYPFDAVTGSGDVVPTYTVTLRNTSKAYADVSGIAVTFSNTAGNEVTSDQEYATGIVSPNQALTWTFNVPNSLVGTVVIKRGGWLSGPDEIDKYYVGASSCQLAQWS